MIKDSPVGEPRFKARGVDKHFGPVQALTKVDLDLYAGQVTALCGDNGAGKSVLTKCIAGIYEIDHGQFFWEGNPVHIRSPRESARLGIETVYQDLALASTLDASENVFLGREVAERGFLGRLGFIDRAAMRRRTAEQLSAFGITLPSERMEIGALSGGQRQAVAVARAAMWGGRVLLLDEPTAALGVHQRELVFRLMRTARDAGLAIVFISHNILEIFEVADRITVLRLGRTVLTSRISDTTADEVVGAMAGLKGSA
jgi:simple sugar transport system ATP-binding protein